MKRAVILVALTCFVHTTARAWRAYNDLAWFSGQATNNITTLTRNQSGSLVDYDTGDTLAATLTIDSGGSGPYTQGTNATGGDAKEIFDGIVDCAGHISYGTNLTFTFSGLDQHRRYEVVLFGNRNEPAYTDRLTKFIISNVDTFVNDSSIGANIQTTSVTNDSTMITNGWNTANGFVARYTYVDPGTNGQIVITVADGGSTNPPKFYSNALMLRPIDAWVAYNDMSWTNGQLNVGITRYTTVNGPGNGGLDGDSGPLKDYITGVDVPVSITITGGYWNGAGMAADQGADAVAGTDADNVFGGIVCCTGVVGYWAASNLHVACTDLDPDTTYEFVIFGNRDNLAYGSNGAQRVTSHTIQDVTGFFNQSTLGAGFSGCSDDATVITNGYNSVHGYVARFTDIRPGSDGDLHIDIRDGGSAEPPKFYANACMLRPILLDAFNDLSWTNGQTMSNITLWTTPSGGWLNNQGTNTGCLVDYRSGRTTDARLTVAGGLLIPGQTRLGSDANSGTDAYGVFGGKVNCTGVLSYAETPVTLEFSELDPDLLYEITLFGNRNNPDYGVPGAQRVTKATITNALAWVNTSSMGATISGADDESTTITNGYNTVDGLVARFSDISPAANGQILITVTDGGSTNPPKFYMNAVRLKAYGGY